MPKPFPGMVRSLGLPWFTTFKREMKPVRETIRVATEVIKEGDPGDAFFIVRSGEVSGSSPAKPETVVGLGKCL